MDSAIQAFQSKLDLIARDPDLLRTYEQYEKAASDYTTGIEGAKREGERRGKQIGEQIGEQRGKQIGEQMKAFEIARNCKTAGIPLEQIVSLTGLTIAEIQKL